MLSNMELAAGLLAGAVAVALGWWLARVPRSKDPPIAVVVTEEEAAAARVAAYVRTASAGLEQAGEALEALASELLVMLEQEKES